MGPLLATPLYGPRLAKRGTAGRDEGKNAIGRDHLHGMLGVGVNGWKCSGNELFPHVHASFLKLNSRYSAV